MSQRSDGFTGGVAPNTTAASDESVALERRLRDAARRVRTPPGCRWQSRLTAAELAQRLGVGAGAGLCGVAPDGGMWLDEDTGRPLLVAEAKKQGAAGNAIERWYKNWQVFDRLGVGVYLTVCAGDGFFDDNPAQRTLELAVALDPHEAPRLAGPVWNRPRGRLWLYRWRRAGDAGDLVALLDRALAAARRTPAR